MSIKCFCANSFALLFALLQLGGVRDEIVLNPKGWNLPDTKRMTFVKGEELDVAGIPYKIRVEKWEGNNEKTYRTRNLLYGSLPGLAANRPVLENPLDLSIYRSPDDKILCYLYAREITDKAGFTYGVVITYICDIDNDGMNEFQMEAGIDPSILLTSIVKIKVGLSDETSLIKRTICSALRALK